MIEAVLRLALAGSMLAAPTAAVPSGSVPPPRTNVRPPPARPIAVTTAGFGALTLVSSLALLGVGIHSWRIAPHGRTEGEAHAYLQNGKHLAIVGGSLASVGIALLTGGIVWIVRDRRRGRGGLARR